MSPGLAQVQVVGARELARTLKKAGVQVADMKAANGRVGQIVVRASTPITPVRSGRLAGSIRPSRQQAAVTIRAGGASIPYAGVQHWGWPRHHIRASLFLTTGAENSEPVWVETYFAELNKIIDGIEGA